MFYSGYANYAKTILLLNRVWVNAINQSIISPYALESVQYLIAVITLALHFQKVKGVLSLTSHCSPGMFCFSLTHFM